MDHTLAKEPAQLDLLRRLPFVKGLRFKGANQGTEHQFDGTLEIRTPTGTFDFLVEEKRSFLTRESANELIARVRRVRRPKKQAILFAPYIARPMAESLIEQEIAFVDLAGNLSLDLDNSYHWTELGNKQGRQIRYHPASPGHVQLLIQYLTNRESLGWSVRRLAEEVGIRHAWVAIARKDLQAEGLLLPTGKLQPIRAKKCYELAPNKKVLERIVDGYSRLLRPRLKFGQYRYQEKTPEAFLKRLVAEQGMGRYALTGAAAAAILQHYYTAPEVPVFCYPPSQAVIDRLRLLPDPQGPVTFLHPFGKVVWWEPEKERHLAPPCLIYAELLSSADPRAHEAAEQLRLQFFP